MNITQQIHLYLKSKESKSHKHQTSSTRARLVRKNLRGITPYGLRGFLYRVVLLDIFDIDAFELEHRLDVSLQSVQLTKSVDNDDIR